MKTAAILMILTAAATGAESARREMATDRPDITESAFSVVRGMWQVEAEAVSVSRDDGLTSVLWGATNIKYGLTERIDLQWVTPGWLEAEDGPDGWTDSDVRLKINLCGQEDDAPVAVALLPFVKLPVASGGLGNGHWEGGLAIPMAATRTGAVDLAWMVQGDVLRKETGGGWTGEFTLTATAGTAIAGNLSGFVEAVAVLPLEGATAWYANGGLVHALSDDWVLDCGVNLGLNEAAVAWRFFAGTSFRF